MRRATVVAPAGSAEKPLLSSAVANSAAAISRKQRRSRLRILRLLEVTETRRASGVARNAGNRQVHARREGCCVSRSGTSVSNGMHDDKPTGFSKGKLLSVLQSSGQGQQ